MRELLTTPRGWLTALLLWGGSSLMVTGMMGMLGTMTGADWLMLIGGTVMVIAGVPVYLRGKIGTMTSDPYKNPEIEALAMAGKVMAEQKAANQPPARPHQTSAAPNAQASNQAQPLQRQSSGTLNSQTGARSALNMNELIGHLSDEPSTNPANLKKQP